MCLCVLLSSISQPTSFYTLQSTSHYRSHILYTVRVYLNSHCMILIVYALRTNVAKYARTKESRDNAEHDGPEVEPPVAPGLHIDEKLHELEAQI